MKHNYVNGLIIASCLLSMVSAADIDLTGTIMDSVSGTPIAGAVVKLTSHPDIYAVTHTDGTYALSSTTTLPANLQLPASSIRMMRDRIDLTLSGGPTHVIISMFTLSGRLADVPADNIFSGGFHRFTLPAGGLADRMYIVKITAGSTTRIFRYLHSGCALSAVPAGREPKSAAPSLSAKKMATADTLLVIASGYARARKPIAGYSGVTDFNLIRNGATAGQLLNAVPTTADWLPKSLLQQATMGPLAKKRALDDITVIDPAAEPEIISSSYTGVQDEFHNNTCNILMALLKLCITGKTLVPDEDMAVGSIRIPSAMKHLPNTVDSVQDMGRLIMSMPADGVTEFRWFVKQRMKTSATDTGTPIPSRVYIRVDGADTATMKVAIFVKLDFGAGTSLTKIVSYNAALSRMVEITPTGSFDLGVRSGERQIVTHVNGILNRVVQAGAGGLQKKAWADDTKGVLVYEDGTTTDTTSGNPALSMYFFDSTGQDMVEKYVSFAGVVRNIFPLRQCSPVNGSFAKKEGGLNPENRLVFSCGILDGATFTPDSAIGMARFWTDDASGEDVQVEAYAYVTPDSLPASTVTFNRAALVSDITAGFRAFEATIPAFDPATLQAQADSILPEPDFSTFPEY